MKFSPQMLTVITVFPLFHPLVNHEAAKNKNKNKHSLNICNVDKRNLPKKFKPLIYMFMLFI